jgi:hypothetical protein
LQIKVEVDGSNSSISGSGYNNYNFCWRRRWWKFSTFASAGKDGGSGGGGGSDHSGGTNILVEMELLIKVMAGGDGGSQVDNHAYMLMMWRRWRWCFCCRWKCIRWFYWRKWWKLGLSVASITGSSVSRAGGGGGGANDRAARLTGFC